MPGVGLFSLFGRIYHGEWTAEMLPPGPAGKYTVKKCERNLYGVCGNSGSSVGFRGIMVLWDDDLDVRSLPGYMHGMSCTFAGLLSGARNNFVINYFCL